jgi:hypothetical protein
MSASRESSTGAIDPFPSFARPYSGPSKLDNRRSALMNPIVTNLGRGSRCAIQLAAHYTRSHGGFPGLHRSTVADCYFMAASRRLIRRGPATAVAISLLDIADVLHSPFTNSKRAWIRPRFPAGGPSDRSGREGEWTHWSGDKAHYADKASKSSALNDFASRSGSFNDDVGTSAIGCLLDCQMLTLGRAIVDS